MLAAAGPRPQPTRAAPVALAYPKYIAPRALAWFRWGAVATWLTGFRYLTYAHQFISALTLGHGGQDRYGLIIGRGMWIGSIMLFNVWVLIWPNQQKILGLVSASDEQKAKARKVTSLASRTNLRAIHYSLGSVHGFGHTRSAVLRSASSRARLRMIDILQMLQLPIWPRSAGHNCPG